MNRPIFALAILAGCGCGRPASPRPPPAPGGHVVLRGAIIAGASTAQDVELDGATIVAVGPSLPARGATEIDVRGRWLAPAFIDSHVHLAYDPVIPALVAGGVAGAVDLASPMSFLAARHDPLRLVMSGPMITGAPDGYPLDAWGEDGYGLPVTDAASAGAAIDRLIDAGARVIKIPLAGGPELDDTTLAAAVAHAHARGVRVAMHVLGASAARRAAAAGADVLAHTPVEPLPDDVLAAWSGRAVITTLDAFGARDATLANLRALRARGATILYGTDLGNTRVAAINADEIAALQAAGMDGAAILAAATTTPAAFWGMGDLGAIAPGKAASFLVLARDPLVDPSTLATPIAVYIVPSRPALADPAGRDIQGASAQQRKPVE